MVTKLLHSHLYPITHSQTSQTSRNKKKSIKSPFHLWPHLTMIREIKIFLSKLCLRNTFESEHLQKKRINDSLCLINVFNSIR